MRLVLQTTIKAREPQVARHASTSLFGAREPSTPAVQGFHVGGPNTLRNAGMTAMLLRAHPELHLQRSAVFTERVLLKAESEPFDPSELTQKHPGEAIESVVPSGGWTSLFEENDAYIFADLKRAPTFTREENHLLREFEFTVELINAATQQRVGTPRSVVLSRREVVVNTRFIRDPGTELGRFYFHTQRFPFAVVYCPTTIMFGERVDITQRTSGGTTSAGAKQYKGCTDARDMVSDWKRVALAVRETDVMQLLTDMMLGKPQQLPVPNQDEDDDGVEVEADENGGAGAGDDENIPADVREVINILADEAASAPEEP